MCCFGRRHRHGLLSALKQGTVLPSTLDFGEDDGSWLHCDAAIREDARAILEGEAWRTRSRPEWVSTHMSDTFTGRTYNDVMDPNRLSAVCRARGVRLMLQIGIDGFGPYPRRERHRSRRVAWATARFPGRASRTCRRSPVAAARPGGRCRADQQGGSAFSSRRSRSSAGFSTAYRERCAS